MRFLNKHCGSSTQLLFFTIPGSTKKTYWYIEWEEEEVTGSEHGGSSMILQRRRRPWAPVCNSNTTTVSLQIENRKLDTKSGHKVYCTLSVDSVTVQLGWPSFELFGIGQPTLSIVGLFYFY